MNKLKYLREDSRLSLRKLAELVDIDFSTLNKIEKEERNFTASTLKTLAVFFEVTTDFLLGIKDDGIFVEYENGMDSLTLQDYEELVKANDIEIYVYTQVMRQSKKILQQRFVNEINNRSKPEGEMLSYSKDYGLGSHGSMSISVEDLVKIFKKLTYDEFEDVMVLLTKLTKDK